MFRNEATELHTREAEAVMKYIFAWVLGIPTSLIVLWFLFNHMH
jgi:hypothetical protein